MTLLKQIQSRIFNSKGWLLIYLIIINLPLVISTFNTANWSDDYQMTNLLAVKAKFSPLLPILLEPIGGNIQGGHFAPVFNLINYIFTAFTVDPGFFHLLVVITFILTGLLIYLIVELVSKDKLFALLAATLFCLNYYVNFKALAWNCFHSHATNTFTGMLSIYLLLRYFKTDKIKYLALSCLCFILTIFNLESGFVFFPIILIISLFYLAKKRIPLKVFLTVFIIISLAMSLFPLSTYLRTGKAMPLDYRFNKDYKSNNIGRSLQGYAFNANELFIKSTGFAIVYNKLIFDNLKQNNQIKETIKQAIRENNLSALKNMPLKFIFMFVILGILTIALFSLFIVLIFQRISQENIIFLICYMVLFLIYVFIFNRTDVANAIAVFSSIIIANLIVSLLRDKDRVYRWAGLIIIGMYLIVTLWTALDKFDDCYRKSFFGLSKVAVQGTDKIYNDINNKLGHFAENGLLLFTHDYSAYHKTTGYERIGDMVNIGDLASFNATKYSKELLKTEILKQYANKSLREFSQRFTDNPNYKKIIVSSEEDAKNYLRKNKVDTRNIGAIYLSKDYKVIKL